MTAYTLTAGYGNLALTGENSSYTGVYTYTESVRVTQLPVVGWGITATSGIGVSPALSFVYQAGPTVAETAKFSEAYASPIIIYPVLAETVQLALAQYLGFPVTATSQVIMSSAVASALGVTVLQSLFVTDPLSPTAHFQLSMSDLLSMASGFANFFNLSVHDTAGMSSTAVPSWLLTSSAGETLQLSDLLSQSFIVQLTAQDGVIVSDAEVLQMIFSGTIADGVDMSAMYVDPNNTITTWAINTRTSAITEYQNFSFVSYAQIGNKYIGASSSGLYELNGIDDAGTPIPASFASGMLQLGDSHFTSFQTAYLGTGQPGEFFLKLTTGTGVSYTYRVSAQPMRTTRVNIGKGIRTRYLKYELYTVDGHDFDLDNIEFVPIVSKRRVD